MRNVVVVSALVLLSACEGPTSSLTVAIYGEEYIEQAIPAEDVVDGWTITFDRFLISVGDIFVSREGESRLAQTGVWNVFDLAQDSGGQGFTVFGPVETEVGRYDAVEYRIAPPVSGDVVAGNASEADVERMKTAQAAIIAEGRATRGDVTKTFAWVFDTDTRYEDCASTADVVEGAPGRIELTLHADHLFYDDLVSDEPNVAFDLIAQSDADDDGVITEAELRATDLRTQTRYGTGSTGITDLWNFIRAQSTTLGHIDGEGHCHARPAN